MIRVFDITGKLVFEKESLIQTKIKISTANFQPGMNIIYLASEKLNSVEKLTKE